jgi:hypothetical protein
MNPWIVVRRRWRVCGRVRTYVAFVGGVGCGRMGIVVFERRLVGIRVVVVAVLLRGRRLEPNGA